MGVSTKFVKEVIRVFVFAFIPVFVATITGVSAFPDMNTLKALAVSAVTAGAAAGVKAVLDFITKGVEPAPSVGILPPSVKE